MDTLKLLKAATNDSAEFMKKKMKAMLENPHVDDSRKNNENLFYPNEADFVAELYHSIRTKLGANSKFLILEGSPYIDKKLKIRPDLSYRDRTKSKGFVAEVKTITKNYKELPYLDSPYLTEREIDEIKPDCHALNALDKTFGIKVHIIILTAYENGDQKVNNKKFETRTKNKLKCKHKIITAVALVKNTLITKRL